MYTFTTQLWIKYFKPILSNLPLIGHFLNFKLFLKLNRFIKESKTLSLVISLIWFKIYLHGKKIFKNIVLWEWQIVKQWFILFFFFGLLFSCIN